MTQLPPIIKKTKKSSYKPLHKLNEDNLLDLKRVDQPETSSKVVYFNSMTTASLRTNVKIWFKDHHHTMAIIDKQQRDAWKLLCRVQRDKHRAKRDKYKRKQQEIRDSIKTLQVGLMQKRVVQKFRINATNKMGVRRQSSTAESKLSAQESDTIVTDSDIERAVGEENTTSVGRSENKNPLLTADDKYPLKDNILQTSTSQALFIAENENLCAESAKCNNTKFEGDVSYGSVAKESDTCVTKFPKLSEPSGKQSPHNNSRRSIVSPGIPNHGANVEVRSPATSGKINTAAGFEKSYRNHCPVEESTVTISSKVVEVRKNRPNSPSTTVRKQQSSDVRFPAIVQVATPSQSIAHKSLALLQKDPDNLDQPKTLQEDDAVPAVLDPGRNVRRCSLEDTDRATTRKVKKTKAISFLEAPGHDENLKNVLISLSTEKSLAMGSGTKNKPAKRRSLASLIRLQRHQEEKQRSRILDEEPVVQYRRNARGSLQQTEPRRRGFPVPTGRPQYQRMKLLQAEQQKDLDRKQHIDDFFAALPLHQSGGKGGPELPEVKEENVSTSTSTPMPRPGQNHLQRLLESMGLQLPRLSNSLHPNSAEELAKCRYLRLKDRALKTKIQRETFA